MAASVLLVSVVLVPVVTMIEVVPQLQNRCDTSQDSWTCALHQGVDFMLKNLENAQNDEDRTFKMSRKFVVPLLVGVMAVFLSTVPLVLLKLVLLGVLAIGAGKLSLVLSLIMFLKKFFGEGGFLSLNPLGYQHLRHPPEPQQVAPHRRATFLVRGRDFQGHNDTWIDNTAADELRFNSQLPRPEPAKQNPVDESLS